MIHGTTLSARELYNVDSSLLKLSTMERTATTETPRTVKFIRSARKSYLRLSRQYDIARWTDDLTADYLRGKLVKLRFLISRLPSDATVVERLL